MVPLIKLLLALAVKNLMFRPFRPGPRSHSQWERLHCYMLDALFAHGLLSKISTILGPNLQGTQMGCESHGCFTSDTLNAAYDAQPKRASG